jgi:nitroreductase|tara:strand:- start:2102 stop:2734 length:633 start_codon:yes stop_codon:yes gene_type:complete
MSEEMGMFEVMYNCRAMRRLQSTPVPEEMLIKLIDAANQAPTGSNAQNARWIIVRDQAQKEQLAELNKKAVDVYAGGDSQRAAALPHQSAEKRVRQLNAVLWQSRHMHEIPALIVACLAFGAPIDAASAGRGGGSIWPAVQNLLLAARGLGLGAAPTTLALSSPKAVREILHLPDNMAAFCLIPVGYPIGKFGPVTRMPVEETVRWDRWD